MRALRIANRVINDTAPPYVIAEVGHNHCGNLDLARKLIATVAACGADAVKFQKRDNATLYTKAMLAQPYVHEHSYGPTYGAHRDALEFSFQQYVSCRATAQACKVHFFATAFDEPSVDFLMRLDVPAIKIASGGLTDTLLLKYAALTGKPLIISSGGGTIDDVERALQTIGHDQVAVLHCTAAYPVRDFTELNLRVILSLRQRFPDVVIGWSGHVSGIAMALVAYAFGARIIEQHVTLDRTFKGTDHAFSLEPVGVRKLVRDLGRAREALGDGIKVPYPSEFAPLAKMRRWLIDGKWQIGTPDEQTPKVIA